MPVCHRNTDVLKTFARKSAQNFLQSPKPDAAIGANDDLGMRQDISDDHCRIVLEGVIDDFIGKFRGGYDFAIDQDLAAMRFIAQ